MRYNLLKSLSRQLLGLVITAFFLALVIINIKFDDVGVAFGQANYLYLLPAIVITFVAYLVRAWRWQVEIEMTSRLVEV